jgi:RNA polymerase sigma factor (sigma-70 family)
MNEDEDQTPRDRDMNNLAPPEHEAPPRRLTDEQAQDLVLKIVGSQAESLLRTAYRHSICDDDAHDAYQRSMEIFLRRAHTLDPESAHRWIHVVVKHEAMEVRRARSAALGFEEADLEGQASRHAASPEEQVLGAERTRRATEALKRLKPQELRAMWLKALGHSYAEIGEATGYSATKVNRSLTEGRKSFLERFEGLESGAECERWQPVLDAMVAGHATAEQMTDARPHLRNCPACRAQLREQHLPRRPLAAMLPVGLIGTLGRLVERVLPGGEAAVGAAGGAKLAAILATGAAATAGGGFVMAQEAARDHERAPKLTRTTTTTATRQAAAPTSPLGRSATTAVARASTTAAPPKRPRPRKRLTVARRAGRIEFAPHSADRETTTSNPPPRPSASTAHAASATPRQLSHPSAGPDSVRGEFSPQP